MSKENPCCPRCDTNVNVVKYDNNYKCVYCGSKINSLLNFEKEENSQDFKQMIRHLKNSLEQIKKFRQMGKISYFKAEELLKIQNLKIEFFEKGYKLYKKEINSQLNLNRYLEK